MGALPFSTLPEVCNVEQILAEHYGLKGCLLHPLHGGAINQVVRVGDSLVLKRYNPELVHRDRVILSTDGQRYLAERGHPVPAFVRNRAGALVTEVDGACYVLATLVPGRHRAHGEFTARAAYDLGRTLGRIVQDLVAYRPEERGANPQAADGYDFYPPEQTLARIEEVLPLARQGRGPVDERIVAVLTHKRDGLGRLAPWYPRLASLPRQWIHGDFHETNLFFDADDRLTGVIDFDNLRWGTRAFEFMRALVHCFPVDAPERADYFRGFAEVVNPTAAELELYAPLWVFIELSDIWPMPTRYLSPQAYNPAWDESIRLPSDWWERHIEEVTAWLLAMQRSHGSAAR